MVLLLLLEIGEEGGRRGFQMWVWNARVTQPASVLAAISEEIVAEIFLGLMLRMKIVGE